MMGPLPPLPPPPPPPLPPPSEELTMDEGIEEEVEEEDSGPGPVEYRPPPRDVAETIS